ncbi:MAG TPA: extracellular solute-binding protein [Woeseiaceae bacterium]|nr:extracellular solute-binding protein [Woeseiaceae bacterium]
MNHRASLTDRAAAGGSGRHSHDRRRAGARAAAVAAAALVAGCGDDGTGKPTLTWYINPDPPPPPGFAGTFGQPGIAERCSTDEYTIATAQLPTSASEQRIQLARRLAAGDESIDLVSLDPVFTAEFADAGFLWPIPPERQRAFAEGVLQGAIAGATWEGELVVVPMWANTQVLWYRKSFAEQAGLRMDRPVTWDQIIEAASAHGGKVGVQANKYEGYVVWINALIMGAGGEIITDTESGDDAAIHLDSAAAAEAARIVRKLATSPAAEADLSVSNEGTVLGPFAESSGFQVNWTFVYTHYPEESAVRGDLGWARYPRTVAGRPSRPPIGGINIGIGASTRYPEQALAAIACITSLENQVRFAVETGQMPAREAAYDAPGLTSRFPADLLSLYRESIQEAGPRPATPYWATIVNAILSRWHPPRSVDPDTTPEQSEQFVRSVLRGDSLT